MPIYESMDKRMIVKSKLISKGAGGRGMRPFASANSNEIKYPHAPPDRNWSFANVLD